MCLGVWQNRLRVGCLRPEPACHACSAHLQAPLDELHGEAARVNGCGWVQGGYDPGQRPDVVLVPVGDHHRLNLVPPLRQERGVGQDLLHAQVGEAAGQKRRQGARVRAH